MNNHPATPRQPPVDHLGRKRNKRAQEHVAVRDLSRKKAVWSRIERYLGLELVRVVEAVWLRPIAYKLDELFVKHLQHLGVP